MTKRRGCARHVLEDIDLIVASKRSPNVRHFYNSSNMFDLFHFILYDIHDVYLVVIYLSNLHILTYLTL